MVIRVFWKEKEKHCNPHPRGPPHLAALIPAGAGSASPPGADWRREAGRHPKGRMCVSPVPARACLVCVAGEDAHQDYMAMVSTAAVSCRACAA